MAVSTPKCVSALIPASALLTSRNRAVPKTENISSMPRMKPESPMRFTMNAFLPASAADFLWK